MNRFCLTFYTCQTEKYHHMLIHEWLLKFAKKHAIQSTSVFRAIAAYIRGKVIHQEHFFELIPNLPIKN